MGAAKVPSYSTCCTDVFPPSLSGSEYGARESVRRRDWRARLDLKRGNASDNGRWLTSAVGVLRSYPGRCRVEDKSYLQGADYSVQSVSVTKLLLLVSFCGLTGGFEGL